jgi:TonB family protein
MPATQIPPPDPLTPAPAPDQRDLFEAQTWEMAYRGFNPEAVPHLLIQLQDDLSRARKREALWLSVIIHLFVIILLWNSEKIITIITRRPVELAIRTDVDRAKGATFLELPPDAQKLTRRPDAKVLSDKDRIATSKAPQIDREELKKILESAHPGQPGANAQQPQGQAAQNQPAPQENPQGTTPPGDQTSQLRIPPQNRPQPNFNAQMTAGSAIDQALKAAAANRGRYGAGESGDSGLSHGRSGANAALGQAEILSDTMGVDFAPYITRILQTIRQNWINGLPPSAYPPIWKQGKTGIDFVILKDGKVSNMALHSSSGDVALDRSAWGGITGSNPFPPLPKEFPGPNIVLRIGFFCNMDITDLK